MSGGPSLRCWVYRLDGKFSVDHRHSVIPHARQLRSLDPHMPMLHQIEKGICMDIKGYLGFRI